MIVRIKYWAAKNAVLAVCAAHKFVVRAFPCLCRLYSRRVMFVGGEKLDWYNINHKNVVLSGLRSGWISAFLPDVSCSASAASMEKLRFFKSSDIDEAVAYRVLVERKLGLDKPSFEMEQRHKCASLALKLEDLYYSFRPTTIVYIQGFFPEAVLCRILAVRLGIAHFALDMPFVKDKLIVESVTGIAVNRTSAKVGFYSRECNMAAENCAAYKEKFLSELSRKKQKHHIPGPNQDVASLGVKFPYMLFLGQVLIDSSILCNDQSYPDAAELVEKLHAIAISKGMKLVVKCHPQENKGLSAFYHVLDRPLHKKIRHLEFSNDIIIDSNNSLDTFALIKNAKVTVTMNSQAGFEAALMGIPSVICGEAFFSGLGFTYDVPRKEYLEAAIEAALTHGTDGLNIERRDKFLRYYVEEFLVDKNYSALESKFLC